MKKVNDELISTLQEVSKITQEGAKKRKLIETELNKVETDLKDRLLNHGNSQTKHIELSSSNDVGIEEIIDIEEKA